MILGCGTLTVKTTTSVVTQQWATECPQDPIYVSVNKNSLNCGNDGKHGDPTDSDALDCFVARLYVVLL